MAAALEGLARAALTNREPERAAELLARAAAVRATYDRPATPTEAAGSPRQPPRRSERWLKQPTRPGTRNRRRVNR